MSLGLAGKFNILEKSPHDATSLDSHSYEEIEDSLQVLRWKPSRYTVRAVTSDGRIVLWNTLKATISIFQPHLRARVERLLSQKGISARRKGLIEFLADRGFIIGAEDDEFRQFQLMFGQQHYDTQRLQLILMASEDCNFRCEYCYEEFARGTMKPWVRDAIKTYVSTRASHLENLTLDWFGGEPLYGLEAVEDLAPYFHNLASKEGLNLSSKMTTNGYLLNPEIAERLLNWGIRIYQITLDGPEKFHDKSRPARDGGGTYKKILENLVHLKKFPHEYRVDIRVNFNPENYPYLESFMDTLSRDFYDDARFKIHFRAVGKWGGPNDDQLSVCGIGESRELTQQLKRVAKEKGLHLSDDIRQVKRLGAQVCYASRPYSFLIGATGKIMKCTIDLDLNDRNIIGHFNKDGTMKLDNEKMALWTEPAFQNDKKCQRCVVLPTCQGISCPPIRFNTGKSPCTRLRSDFKKELRAAAASIQKT